VLKQLRDLGNTVIVVEHEEEVIRAADRIIDIGPEAGYNGGEVVFNGTLPQLLDCTRSLTADYLTGRRSIAPPAVPRGWNRSIVVKGARANNLRNIDVRIPLGAMTCITGVSGSGKSSLAKGILYPALRRLLCDTGAKPGDFDGIEGDIGLLKAVEMVDQNPIGKSSRSNPVTYIKAYDEIRKLFSDLPYSKHNALTPAHFSFNVAGGRCEECQGEGVIKVSMQFMADVTLVCEACGGRRFRDEVLEAKWLYETELSKIGAVVHPESIVHSLVYFQDGAALAQLGYPDMRLPIQLALNAHARMACCKPLDLAEIGALHFERLPEERFPCFRLALQAGEAGGTCPAILNGAGEEAVRAFLNGSISFPQIAETIGDALAGIPREEAASYAALKEADVRARERARHFIYGK